MILDDEEIDGELQDRDYDDSPEMMDTVALDRLAEHVWRDALIPANHDRQQAQASIWRALDDTRVELEPSERGYITTKLLARVGYGG